MLTLGRDVYKTDLRGRASLRMQLHNTALYEMILYQVGVKIIIHFQSQLLKELDNIKHFKSKLKQHLLTYDFHSVGKFTTTWMQLGWGGGGYKLKKLKITY